MVLYHGTTKTRATGILKDRCIKKNIDRFYTEENNGNGYTTQGYVYLTNEITFAVSFASSHNLCEKSDKLYIFRFEIPDEIIEADYDELRHQIASPYEIESYGGDLACSLFEYKSCRIPRDINISDYNGHYCVINCNDFENVSDLYDYAGYDYKYVIENYTDLQREFIDSINWIEA